MVAPVASVPVGDYVPEHLLNGLIGRDRRVRSNGAAISLSGAGVALPDPALGAPKDHREPLFGIAPPLRLGRALLVKGIAHRLQGQTLGALKPVTPCLLAQARDDIAMRRDPSPLRSKIKLGTRL